MCGSSTETPTFSVMECSDEDIEEARQINHANDDAEMFDVFYDDEEPVITHNRQNPFDSDDSLDDYDFAKYKKRGESQSSSEGEDEDEESKASNIHSSHSSSDDDEDVTTQVITHWKDLYNFQNPLDSDHSLDDHDFAKYKKRGQSRSSSEGGDEDEESKASDIHSSHSSSSSDEDVTTQAYEFEQGMPLSPSEEYDDGAIDGNDDNDIPSSHLYNDYGDAMYEDNYGGEAMHKVGRTQSNEFNQREPWPLSEDSSAGSTHSDDENDLLDKDYVPTPLDKDDEDCLAEINSDSDDYEDQEDNDFLYCK